MEFAEPSVTADRDQFVCGGEVNIMLEQRARSALTVESTELALTCTKTTKTGAGRSTQYASEEFYAKRLTVLSAHKLTADEPISARQELAIPSYPPTSVAEAYPRYDWAIEVHVKVHQRPGYRGKFPIVIRPASEPAPASASTWGA
jgi:hypothetical protein